MKKLERLLVVVMIGLLAANLIVGQLTVRAEEVINSDPLVSASPAQVEVVEEADTTSEDENIIEGDLSSPEEDVENANQEDSAVQEPVETQTPEVQAEPQTLTFENDDVIVTVSEETAGIIPANVTLSVTPIIADDPETKDQYAEVEEKLNEKAAGEDYDIAGFLAYDIKLLDSKDNEVEPNGAVKVSLEYKKAVAPEGLDEETVKDANVTVMHLEEDENGEVKDVVDMSQVVPEGQTEEQAENKIETLDTDAANNVEKMEFVADSFSTYVITWNAVANNNIPDGDYIIYTESGGKYYALTSSGSAVELTVGTPSKNKSEVILSATDSATLANQGVIWSKSIASTDYYNNRDTFKNGSNNLVLNSDYNSLVTNNSNWTEWLSYENQKLARYAYSGSWKAVEWLKFNPGNQPSFSGTKQGNWDGSTIYLAKVIETMDTVDTRALGVTLNLFDYGPTKLDENETWGNGGSGSNIGINENKKLMFYYQGQTSSGTDRINKYNENAPTTPTYNIVESVLQKDSVGNYTYPKLADYNQSLDYLFDGNDLSNSRDGTYKKVYNDVNHLFYEENGYYVYDSAVHYAYYNSNEGGGDFVVYKETYKNSKNNEAIGFFPFNKYDSSNKNIEGHNNNNVYNHHFGMTMDAHFKMPKAGQNNQVDGKDMEYKFSGDDDMWVFVDGRLVLDIGGIHQPISGSINFTTGEVKINGNVVKNLSDIFGTNWNNPTTGRFQPNSKHELKAFYLERGGQFSNLKLSFNLLLEPPVPPEDIGNDFKVDKTIDKTNVENEFEITLKVQPTIVWPKETRITYESFEDLIQQSDFWLVNNNNIEIGSADKIYSGCSAETVQDAMKSNTHVGKVCASKLEAQNNTTHDKKDWQVTSIVIKNNNGPDFIYTPDRSLYFCLPQGSGSSFTILFVPPNSKSLYLKLSSVSLDNNGVLTIDGKDDYDDIQSYIDSYIETETLVNDWDNAKLYLPDYVIDPMGDHIDFLGGITTNVQKLDGTQLYTAKSTATYYEDPTSYKEKSYEDTIIWDKFEDIPVSEAVNYERVEKDDGKVYYYYNACYVLKYKVRVDVLDNGFTPTTPGTETTLEPDKHFFYIEDSNPLTKVPNQLDANGETYLIKTVNNKDEKTNFPIPQAYGYLGTLNIHKIDDSTPAAAVGGAVFQLVCTQNVTENPVAYYWTHNIDGSPNPKIKTTDSITGNLTFNTIPWGTYTLHEASAPDGYRTVSDISITVSKGVITINGTSSEYSWNANTGTLTIIDPRIASLDLKKVDFGQDTPLTGAKFKLEIKSGSDYVTYTYNGNSYNDVEVKNGADEIEFVDCLKDGEYRLTETVAPTGYALMQQKIEFKIQAGKLVYTTTNMCTNTSDDDMNSLKVKNLLIYSLPSSGGHGIFVIMFGGSLLMACAAGLVIFRKKFNIC